MAQFIGVAVESIDNCVIQEVGGVRDLLDTEAMAKTAMSE